MQQESNEGSISIWRALGRRLADPITLFTGALVVVGILQWRTLDQTDHTLRVQQRAFVSILAPPIKGSERPARKPSKQRGQPLKEALHYPSEGAAT
jgi:hypothetical protein